MGRVVTALAIGVLHLTAEQLITKTYSSLDGLADNTKLGSILQDSRGFIWAGTALGLSRFDGQQFQNFTVRDGLPYPSVNNVIETRNGEVWAATNGGGVARYDPRGSAGHQFVAYRTGPTAESNAVNSLREGPDGTIWAATDCGVYRLDRGAREFRLDFIPPARPESASLQEIIDILPEAGNLLWIATNYQGLFRRNGDGSLAHWGAEDGLGSNPGSLFRDRGNALWIVTAEGALRIDRNAAPGRSPVIDRLQPESVNRGHAMAHMIQDRHGDYWVTGEGGLFRREGFTLHRLGRHEGIPGEITWGLTEDRDGNLWVGVEGAGILQIIRHRAAAWSVPDGLAKPTVVQLFALPESGVAAVSWDKAGLRTQAFRDRRFYDLTPGIPVPFLAGQHPVLQDHLGDLWVATQKGVERFRNGRLMRSYGPREGWPGGAQGSLYETSSGDIWLARWQRNSFLGRWKRNAPRMESLANISGSPALLDPWDVVEDAEKNLWVAGLHGLYRYREGHFIAVPSPFAAENRLIANTLHVDNAGHVWIGYTRGRVGIMERPSGAVPNVRLVELADGSLESAILSLTSDRDGRLYVGSGTGLWLFDPRNRRTVSYGEDVPILRGRIYCAARGTDGNLWFGTDSGLVEISPPEITFGEPPQVRLTQVRLIDRLYPLSGWGEQTVRAPRFPDWQNRLEFSFSGVGSLGRLRYRYRLEPHDSGWSPATLERTVIYPRLPAGNYRFAVQATDPAGNNSRSAASFSFEIAAPIWQRWWFLILAALALAASTYGAWRFRIKQIMAVERVRMRIATDLHDDIGSALTHIGLLSEAARAIQDEGAMSEALERVATVSRETASSMADIVWTINPRRDSLSDLTVRIRRFASEMFSGNIVCAVLTPESDGDLKLGLEVRRQLLLVAKEAVHNAARHSRGTRVTVELRPENRWVLLRITDDGQGFDPLICSGGHGIASMRSRAEGLGGKFLIETGLGKGTRLEVRIPQ